MLRRPFALRAIRSEMSGYVGESLIGAILLIISLNASPAAEPLPLLFQAKSLQNVLQPLPIDRLIFDKLYDPGIILRSSYFQCFRDKVFRQQYPNT
jgi:hypothetical protein